MTEECLLPKHFYGVSEAASKRAKLFLKGRTNTAGEGGQVRTQSATGVEISLVKVLCLEKVSKISRISVFRN